MSKQTKLTVLNHGDVMLSHEHGYMVVGNEEAVCFFIDPVGRAYISCSTTSYNDCPVVYLATDESEQLTEVEFSDYPGWRFHAGGAGKSIAIALVNRKADKANDEYTD